MKLTELELLEKLNEYSKKKYYSDGLKLISENEDVISKKYYQIMTYKISFLIETHNYIEANYLIKDELSVPYIPIEFEEFLFESKRIVDFALKKAKPRYSSDDIEDIDKLDNDTLLSILPDLKKYNLVGYHNQLQNIFLNTQIFDLTKSLLIACLSDVKLNETFYVIKEGVTIKFNPCEVFDIRVGENFTYVEENINKLVNVEINTLEIINKIATTYLLNIYPLVISEFECDLLIAATLILSSKMTNCTAGSVKYDEIIQNHRQEVIKMCEKLNILLESI